MNSDKQSRRSLPILWIALGLIAGLLIGLLISNREPEVTLERILDEADQMSLGNARLRRILQFAERSTAEEIEEALDRVLANNPSGRNYEVVRIFYSRWIDLDLDAALTHAESQEGEGRRAGIGPVISLWAAMDSTAALEWVQKNAREADGFLGNTVLAQIARTDPARALALWKENASLHRNGFSESPASFYGAWAMNDPAAAAAHLLKEEDNYWSRRDSAQRIAGLWAEKDPQAAWDFAKSFPQPEVQEGVISSLLSMLAIRNLEKAKAFVETLPEGKDRKFAVESLIDGLVIADAEAAYDYAKQQELSVAGDANVYTKVFMYWRSKAPDRAFEIAKEFPPGAARTGALRDIIQDVSNKDADRAIEMLEGLGPDTRLPYIGTFLGGAIAKQQDVERALTWAESLSDGEMRKEALSAIMTVWLEESPTAAAGYALEASANDPQQSLLKSTITRWGYQDPEAAIQWAREHLEIGVQRAQLPNALAKWGEKDLAAASAWAEALPSEKTEDADLKNACIARLAYQWAQFDPVGGEGWLDSLPAGPARDQALGNYSQRLFDSGPENALNWAMKIEDEKLRERYFDYPARRWLKSEPKKAQAWIQSAELPDETKQNLLGK